MYIGCVRFRTGPIHIMKLRGRMPGPNVFLLSWKAWADDVIGVIVMEEHHLSNLLEKDQVPLSTKYHTNFPEEWSFLLRSY